MQLPLPRQVRALARVRGRVPRSLRCGHPGPGWVTAVPPQQLLGGTLLRAHHAAGAWCLRAPRDQRDCRPCLVASTSQRGRQTADWTIGCRARSAVPHACLPQRMRESAFRPAALPQVVKASVSVSLRGMPASGQEQAPATREARARGYPRRVALDVHALAPPRAVPGARLRAVHESALELALAALAAVIRQ
jgi:hypothetical protein